MNSVAPATVAAPRRIEWLAAADRGAVARLAA